MEDDPHRAPVSARFNLNVACLAASKLEHASFKGDPVTWYLYYGSSIIFARAALDALKENDGAKNSFVGLVWKKLFEDEVVKHPIFKEVLRAERHALSHSQLEGSLHPHWPLDVVMRHGGLDAIFGDGPPAWPDGHYKGRTVEEVISLMLKQVSNWIDEVDVQSSNLAGPYSPHL